MPKSHFYDISAIFCQISKIMVPLSEFFCVGLAIENKFWDRNIYIFAVWWSPIKLFVGVAYPKRHIYDISANSLCFLRANMMFYV